MAATQGTDFSQIKVSDRLGAGAQAQSADGTFTAGNLPEYKVSANDGTLGDSGIAASNVALISKVQQEAYVYAADTGSANAYAVTLSPAPTIAAGSEVVFKAAHANTGPSTLAVNGGTAITIKKWSSGSLADLASGDFSAGQIVRVVNDGTYWQWVNGGRSLTLETDGTSNGSQTLLNLKAGTGVTVTDDGTGDVTIAASGVTSVGLSMPSEFSVSGSPVTGSGTITVTKANESPNNVFAGPTSGAAAAPTFRSLVSADIPAISLTSGVSGILPVANGGSGSSSPSLVAGANVTITGSWPNQTIAATGGGGGGGYSAGTVPTVVQVAFGTSNSSVTFASAPTSGNLLVAMTFNPSTNAGTADWTKQVENSGGTDWGNIWTKVAGPSESATQNPLSTNPTTCACIIWEIHGQNASSPFAAGQSQTEQGGTNNVPVLFPCLANCIGLSAIGVVPPSTITLLGNAGAVDALQNTGNRFLAAGHTDLSETPMVGLMTTFSVSSFSKCATCLITS